MQASVATDEKQIGSIDSFFIQVTVLLIILGLTFVISASWHEAVRYFGNPWSFIIRHIVAIIFGSGVMIFASYWHIHWWKKYAWHFLILISLGLLLTIKFGIVSGGARRWLDLGFINLQISEFAKIASALIMSKTLIEGRNRILALATVMLMALIVLKQPDLGSSILIMTGAVSAVFANGFNFLLFLISLSGLGYIGWYQITHTKYQMERVKYWLDPYADPLGHGYNLIQSLKAIGAGGIFGVGLGNSLQKLGPLPISYADFIFSIICEEIGFLGALALLLVFLAWILRALKICFNSSDEFSRVFGTSITMVFAIQVLINIGVTTGLFPITGMTLPLISFGGSSFLSAALIAGILMNISRHN
jgi:cell division protein FtsW